MKTFMTHCGQNDLDYLDKYPVPAKRLLDEAFYFSSITKN